MSGCFQRRGWEGGWTWDILKAELTEFAGGPDVRERNLRQKLKGCKKHLLKGGRLGRRFLLCGVCGVGLGRETSLVLDKSLRYLLGNHMERLNCS